MDNTGKTTDQAEAVPAVASAKAKPKTNVKLKANAYQAEYLGSGTFKISKPKRTKAKRRQSALKNRRRGSRR